MKLLLTLMLLALPALAHAEEDAPQRNIPNYDLESVGLLSSDLQGAFPKSIWKNQPRSEVQFMLENMPTNSTIRELQEMKREFLLSRADTRLIKNDIKIKHYKDIFALRLNKLMELGQYDDAFKLYTNSVTKPESSELAEIGLLLILDEKGIATTCLDAKVLAPQFETNDFWENLDKICQIELGSTNKIEFGNSPILHATYNEDNFSISATYIDLLMGLTPLEKQILFKKGKIDYQDAEFKDLVDQTPPEYTRYFLKDEKFPKNLKTALQEHAANQNLTPTVISELEPDKTEEIKQEVLIDVIKKALKQGDSIPNEWAERLKILAGEHPQNYVFIHFLSALGLTKTKYEVPEERFDQGISHFPEKSAEKLKFIKTLLDKQAKFSNNPASVYEKRLVLSQNDIYNIPKEIEQNWWSDWQKEAENQGFIGLSFLIALRNDNIDVEGESSDIILSVLSSLSTVGLIEKSHQLSKVIMTDMMEHTKGE